MVRTLVKVTLEDPWFAKVVTMLSLLELYLGGMDVRMLDIQGFMLV